MADKYHHGNSPAAWTAVLIIFVGFGIGSAYTVMAQPLGVLAGLVVVALGGVAGLVMRAMGYGQQQITDTHHKVVAARAEAEVAGTSEKAAVSG
ncbi:HGxxPAAW family protein [Streptomyces avicenniae]|uniref:HGxxPAAW family protein n=1 Tax=Streptomyces avicenniae TaxID=500153 RepID=UPI00069BA2BC|nr:HGxxPAAW family protein [Streptomyces avicenniae]